MKFLFLVYPGVDEALAEAIDSKFYDAYKKWKRVKVHESPEVKVACFERKEKKIQKYFISGRTMGGVLAQSSCGPRNTQGSGRCHPCEQEQKPGQS